MILQSQIYTQAYRLLVRLTGPPITTKIVSPVSRESNNKHYYFLIYNISIHFLSLVSTVCYVFWFIFSNECLVSANSLVPILGSDVRDENILSVAQSTPYQYYNQ